MRNAGVTTGQSLVGLVLVSWFLLPMALGQMVLEDWPAEWGVWRAVNILLIAAVALLIGINLVHLWFTLRARATMANLLKLLVVAAVFVLLASGPLLDSDRWSVKPVGVTCAVVGVVLLLLAGREGLRLVSQRHARTVPETAAPRP